ncbi:NAD(P)-dependent oxidoreductase, partial [Streptomyces diastatochromogenes]
SVGGGLLPGGGPPAAAATPARLARAAAPGHADEDMVAAYFASFDEKPAG